MGPWSSLKIMAVLGILALVGAAAISLSSAAQTYVVHMDAAAVAAADRALAGTQRWYEAAMNSLVQLSTQDQEPDEDDEVSEPPPRLLYVYETVVTGFAAELYPRHARSLPHLHGFVSAVPDETLLQLHTTRTPQFLGFYSGKGLWGSTAPASDVVVGVVDTGIWPEHPSFRDGNLPPAPARWKGFCEAGPQFSAAECNGKVVGARAFYKGYEASSGKINRTGEIRSARDSIGHGTHTASTAAGGLVTGAGLLGNAAGAAAGMSPGARVAAYKACWSSGCASSDILAAVDRAVADGVGVLSLSLGGGSRPYYTDTLAIAAFRAVARGVVVVCSAGNSGPSESTVSNTAPWITTVAASYLDRSFPTTVMLGDGRNFTGASLYVGKPTERAQLVYRERAGGEEGGGTAAGYCLPGSLSPRLVRGKVVVCERGLSGRLQKGEEVKLAGGLGMLLLNSDEQGEELFADPHLLPASSLGAAASQAIRKYAAAAAAAASRRPTVVITFHGTVYGGRAPAMAAFSSRGPNPVGPDVIKPDITAPGMSILAAWPPTVSPSLLKGDRRRVPFNIISGTSMSCPHVSGVAALLKSRHPDWSPAAIKSAMMTTAYTADNRGDPIGDISTGAPATPFALGSGHVDPEKAADPGLVYDVAPADYLNYLCSLKYTSRKLETLAGRHYTCPEKRRPAAQPGDLNYPSFAVQFKAGAAAAAANATLTFARTATNVGAGACRYTVRVREPEGIRVTVRPEVLRFAGKGQRLSYTVSFTGRAGRSGRAGSSSFGELVWVCNGYSVRSPVAATWV